MQSHLCGNQPAVGQVSSPCSRPSYFFLFFFLSFPFASAALRLSSSAFILFLPSGVFVYQS